MRSLESRLAALRGGRAGDDVRIDALARRIDRLRSARTAGRGGEKPASETELAEWLGAQILEPGLLQVEERVRFGARHGRCAVAPPQGPVPGYETTADERWLFLDTETTGLSGGAGTVVFLLGLARYRGAELIVRQYLITRFAGEAAMLRRLAAEIDGDTVFVTYNGKSYDLPLLATRLRLYGLPDPCLGPGHLDLLHPVRRRFRKDWENCRLATVERRFLGLEREQDLPGAHAPQAWLDFVKRGRSRALPAVLAHNRLDLLSLAVLLPRFHTDGPAPLPASVRRTAGKAAGRRGLRELRLTLERSRRPPAVGDGGLT